MRIGVPAEADQREHQEADAEPVGEALVTGHLHLEEKDTGQNGQGGKQHDDFNALLDPDPLPQMTELAGIGDSHVALDLRVVDRDRLDSKLFRVAVGNAVAEIEGDEGLVDSADGALHQQLQPEWFSRVKAAAGLHLENIKLRERWRILCRQLAETAMLLVVKPDGSIALNQLNAIENAAAHIARPLEGVFATAGYQNGLVAVVEPFT